MGDNPRIEQVSATQPHRSFGVLADFRLINYLRTRVWAFRYFVSRPTALLTPKCLCPMFPLLPGTPTTTTTMAKATTWADTNRLMMGGVGPLFVIPSETAFVSHWPLTRKKVLRKEGLGIYTNLVWRNMRIPIQGLNYHGYRSTEQSLILEQIKSIIPRTRRTNHPNSAMQKWHPYNNPCIYTKRNTPRKPIYDPTSPCNQ